MKEGVFFWYKLPLRIGLLYVFLRTIAIWLRLNWTLPSDRPDVSRFTSAPLPDKPRLWITAWNRTHPYPRCAHFTVILMRYLIIDIRFNKRY